MKKKKARAKVSSAKSKKKSVAPKSRGPVMPLGDRVLLRPLTEMEVGTKSQFGIIIPDTASKEKPEQGVVVATGPGKREDGVLVPVTVKAGDRVVFSKYSYDEVKVGGKDYFLVSESNILAIITE